MLVTDSLAERIAGGDISLLPQYEQLSSGYLDDNGQKIDDLITWLTQDCGWNAFRVRLFVNPNRKSNDGNKVDPAVCQDLDYVKDLGKRIKDASASFMLDFHYSDTWVDAGHIQAPSVCKDMNADQKAEWIASYTTESLQALIAAGATPDYIQIGNEIMAGFMGIGIDSYKDEGNWDDFLKVLQSAACAAREACPDAQIIIHTDQPGIIQSSTNFYNRIQNAGIDYDIIGLSYYPFWQGDISKLKSGLNSLKSHFPDKQIQIVETGYYFQYWPSSGINYDTRSSWPATPTGQYKMVRDLITVLQDYEQVTGLMYWCPEDAGNGDTGSDWTNYTDLVTAGWTNRGLWDPNKSATGHRIISCTEGNVPKLLKSFLPTSAIGYVWNDASDSQLFDILGKPLNAQPTHDLYIRNGKVVITK